MAGASGRVALLSSLCSGKSTWKIQARVVRIWEAYPVHDPLSPFALNLVLIDSHGTKIEATARKGLMAKFKSELSEEKVYRMSYFAVGANGGGFMASAHEYKILFNDKTKVKLEEDSMIPLNVYSFKNPAEILATSNECDHLIGISVIATNVMLNIPMQERL
ncbi:uncharacterized protein LOC130743943 [Lotus japonicus]|uniref:uncharacterized protein LOC130743943 n=1 Tax=Lotus japonicus TaxID=34305 RepID=UPI00258C5E7C|nr:uncharacterized protein LOC130743943 [Lotus japonicus]